MRLQAILCWTVIATAGLWASACSDVASTSEATPGRSARLVVTGSSTIAPLVGDLAKQFESKHPGVRIDVQTGGSSRGIHDAREGLADIGMVSRNLHDDEQDLSVFPIARDGIGIIVHRDNPVEELRHEQVVGIYTGRLTNWQQVGGGDATIVVVNKAEGRSTLELFLEHFGLKNSDIDADVVIGDNQQGIKTVAGNPDAIGYVSIGTAEYDALHGVPIRLLPVGGIAATVENVRNGSFPLARTLNLVTRSRPSGLADEFIRFAQSEAAHETIAKHYFVPNAR